MAVIGLSPLAVLTGSAWNWTPGAAALAMLSVPVLLAAVFAGRTTALITAGLAAVVCFLEPVFTQHATIEPGSLGFPILSSGVLVGLAGVVGTFAGRFRRELTRLEEQNTQFVRRLYDRSREETAAANKPNGKEAPAEEQIDESTESSRVNYPMLMLALQDIGRRISTSLSLDSLLPTIVNTAKASLKCGRCEIYFWDSRQRTLKNALPPRSRDHADYVPRADVGMASWVLNRRQILTRKDIEDDISLRSLLDEEAHLPDAIAPLAVGGELLGLLIVDEVQQDSTTFDRLLYILANTYALGIKNAQLFQRIEDLARRDGLTGLLNHSSFQEELGTLFEASQARSIPLTVLMSDIDHFKRFNDTHGHQAGDHVLREVARLWKAVLPNHAVIARYGGEEFICALPHEDLDRGRELAESLREELESFPMTFQGHELHVTASFGVSPWQTHLECADELVRQADAALYKAKEAGRNSVCCSSPLPTLEPQLTTD